jgi:predicted O-linked N-acetylglucosamine transferase (SPINDLY family)
VRNDPANAEVVHLLGLLVSQSGNFNESLDWLTRSVELSPRVARYWRNLGAVAVAAGRLDQAAEGYRRAVEIEPGDSASHLSLGGVLHRLGRVEEAEQHHRRAVTLSPKSASAYKSLAHDLTELGRADDAIDCYRTALALDPSSTSLHSDLLFAMQYSDRNSAAERLAEAKRYGQRFPGIRTFTHQKKPSAERTRIGYLSPDFRRHTVRHIIEPILEAHDRKRFEIFCYSAVREPDAVTERLAKLAEHWIPIANLSDDAAAERIHADRIDILVDLTGHMGGNRLPIFARQPAPLQLQIGYPATTGLTAMTHHIADPFCAPLGMENHFTEKLLELPDCGWMYKPCDEYPPVAPLPVLSNGYFTFGCLNNPVKVSETAVKLWSQILKRVPRSRLLLLSPIPNRHLIDRFGREGIEEHRLELAPRVPRDKYLRLFHRIDLSLDPTPYNGETTTCDSLIMGVPAVTRAGEALASRRGACINRNVGLDPLIAKDAEEYVAIATALAQDLESLASLRQNLRQRFAASPMCDGERYTRALEAGYRQILHGANVT